MLWFGMRKEIFLALFVGMSLGLMITFGIYQNRENSQTNQNSVTDTLVNKQMASSSAETQDSVLSITTPEDNLLTNQKNLMVSGTTTPQNMVIIFLNGNEAITTSDDTGNFSKEVQLAEGANLIEVYSVNEDNQSIKKEKSVIYDPSPEDKAAQVTATPTPKLTGSVTKAASASAKKQN